jgi:diamine N-acetyltransferase
MLLRPVAQDEILILLHLMRLMQNDDPWSVPFEEERAQRTVEALLSNSPLGQIWLIEVEAKVIGYIVITFDFSLEYGGRVAWIDEFFVANEARGNGVGQRALELAERSAYEAGAFSMALGVTQGNRAINLYRRGGFKDVKGTFLMKRLR